MILDDFYFQIKLEVPLMNVELNLTKLRRKISFYIFAFENTFVL